MNRTCETNDDIRLNSNTRLINTFKLHNLSGEIKVSVSGESWSTLYFIVILDRIIIHPKRADLVMKRSFKASKLSLTPELARDALSRHAVATATRTCTQGLQQRRHAGSNTEPGTCWFVCLWLQGHNLGSCSPGSCSAIYRMKRQTGNSRTR